MLKFLAMKPSPMLTSLFIVSAAAVLGLTLFASSAFGSLGPAPDSCVVPAHAWICPAGDIPTQVTVATVIAGKKVLVQGAIVVIDLTRSMIQGPSGAPAASCLVPCAGQSLTPQAVTYQSGVATFYLKDGNCCARNYDVWCGSVLIGTIREIRSFDVAGGPSLEVGLDDFALFHLYYNDVATYHGCIDFNDNGSSNDLADFQIFMAHYGHKCS